jgi:hypothetical protein
MYEPSQTVRLQREREKREQTLNINRARWVESEWVLNLLRTQSVESLSQYDDDQLIQWADNIRKPYTKH